MDKIEVRYGGRLGLLRSISRNMDGTAKIDYGQVTTVNKLEWMKAVRRESAAKMEMLWKWSKLAPTLDAEWIGRWGFISTRCNAEEADCEDRRYEVARLLLASGRKNGWEKHKYYASSVMAGGADTFCTIDFHSLEATDFGELGEPGSPIKSDVEECVHGDTPRFRLKFDHTRQTRYMLELDKWFLSNLDKPKRVRGPGNRGEAHIPPMFEFDESVACYSPHGQCVRAALANALHFLEGEAATKDVLSKGRVPVNSLAAASSWLEKNTGRFTLRNVVSPPNTPEAYWLYGQEEGVLIVSMDGRDRHNESSVHAIVVDAGKRKVMDCAERRVLKLVMPIFDICVGDGVRFRRFLEIKRVVRQQYGKRKRKPHKMSKEKQNMLRVRKREERRKELENRPRCKKRIVESDQEA